MFNLNGRGKKKLHVIWIRARDDYIIEDNRGKYGDTALTKGEIEIGKKG